MKAPRLTLAEVVSKGKKGVAYAGPDGAFGLHEYDPTTGIVTGPDFKRYIKLSKVATWEGWSLDKVTRA